MTTRCGRCRGRREIRDLHGLGRTPCPDCEGTGVKVAKSSLGKNTRSIALAVGARCVICGEPATTVHHVVPQQRIKRLVQGDLSRALTDRRNGVPVDEACHGPLDIPTLREGHLHPGFWHFVVEYDLWQALPEAFKTDANWRRLEAAV